MASERAVIFERSLRVKLFEKLAIATCGSYFLMSEKERKGAMIKHCSSLAAELKC